MPTGAVMDAFKNLIRHGKHGRAPAGQAASPVVTDHQASNRRYDDGTTSSRSSRDRDRERERAERAQRSERERQSAQEKAQVQMPSQHDSIPQAQESKYSREAEMIVAEEREAAAKMPQFPTLERYRMIEKMGDGAFSNVFKAVDLQTGQKVAVKVVRKYEMSSSQDGHKHLNEKFKKKGQRVTERANILKEVSIMRGLNHQSIVKLISFSESDEHYFLVLELMGGGELFHQIVKLTYFSEPLARHVILQVAHGIRYLHEERGVVHRDIKPENLLFERIPIIPSKNPVARQYDEEKEDEGEFIPGVGGGGIGRVKIADFGLSKIVWDEQTMTPCGTVGYTAPEIVKDERYSKSVDMWALGCVLYTLLCGFPPFYDESINVLTEKVARGYYTFLSPWWDEISASSKDLISHLLCVDPTQRYTIDEFLAHPWCHGNRCTTPPPTPAAANRNMPMDSPLLASVRGGLRDGRSPGLATLKEAFDVTYAVHRAEEEGARRKRGGGAGGFLHNLNEEDEDEEDTDQITRKYGAEVGRAVDERRQQNQPAQQQQQPQQQQQQYSGAGGADRRMAESQLYQGGRAGPRDQGNAKRRGGGAFDLDMNNATLLGRRHKRQIEPSPLGRFVPQQNGDVLDVPGSPMRID
ncbi:Serine/threonine-protein kinase [Ceratobasidium sp. AG-Ba]|nr:Serine/threonine-protein kinase [Ceratobasidium sp. AG-Ba]